MAHIKHRFPGSGTDENLSHRIPDADREIETLRSLEGFVVLAALGIDRTGKFLTF
jgi:hypothetical protein